MRILTDNDFEDDFLIPDDKFEEAVELCEKHQWDKLDRKLGIFPFEKDNLKGFSYDLSVGNEALFLRSGEKIRLKPGENIDILPSTTVVILTYEYIILSKTFAAIIQPKASYLTGGFIQCSVKADPTWYGQLAITITNTYNEIISLKYKSPFCTMILFELDKPVSKILTKKDVPFLGQKTLEIEPLNLKLWKPKKEKTVIKEDMDNVVDLHGPPFDIVRGMFHFYKDEILHYLDTDWGKTALKEIKRVLWEDEIKYLRNANTMNLVTLVLAVFGWICVIIIFLLRETN